MATRNKTSFTRNHNSISAIENSWEVSGLGGLVVSALVCELTGRRFESALHLQTEHIDLQWSIPEELTVPVYAPELLDDSQMSLL